VGLNSELTRYEYLDFFWWKRILVIFQLN